MRAIVTVIGHDRTGIIAEICMVLAEAGVNILDINQTVMQEFFTMTMLVDTSTSPLSFEELSKRLADKGEDMKMNIRIQREDIFNAMHKI
ncbi:MAG: ACT domain-containing protein [Clostridiales bacterium]|jgi:ACT domain-containing protein|nr:ACT domain-containing protein [Clostridiales bacterium]